MPFSPARASLFFSLLFSAVLSAPVQPFFAPPQDAHRRLESRDTPAASLAIDPALVPAFGITKGAGANVRQEGSCDGFNGVNAVLIPCFCPPDLDVFLQHLSDAVVAGNVLGQPIQFSNDATDTSEDTNRARATAMIILLQNFNGTQGVGCPASSAPNFLSQQKTGIRSDITFVVAD